MRDELLFGFSRPFHSIESHHVVSQDGGRREIPGGRGVCLLFSVHGSISARTREKRLVVSSNEACILEPRGGGGIELRYGEESEFYLVRFRRPPVTGASPRVEMEVPDHSRVQAPGRLTHLLHMYIEESRREKGSRLILHHLLVLALCELVRSVSAEAVDAAMEPGLESIASRVDAYVAAHYHEPIGTPGIARELRYNPYYLERAYHQERGKSIREAINERRIKEACAQLLLSRTQGVAKIAALCGYNDAGYFRRVFKRATHLTPHHYRAVNTTARHTAEAPLLR
jgi:AraC-like DNA-binding protein